MQSIKSIKSIKSNKLSKYIIIFVFVIMLLSPTVTLSGAKSGLLLWFNVIIPSLLPSIIISNIIVSVYGDTFKNPFLYIIFTGLLCGYPLGAATTVQLSDKNKIETKKMQMLMAICNNSSPMFITNFIIISTLNQKSNLFQIIQIIYLPILILLLLFFLYNLNSFHQVNKSNNQLNKPYNELNKSYNQVNKSYNQVDKSYNQVNKSYNQVNKLYNQVDKSSYHVDKTNYQKNIVKKLNMKAIDSSIMAGFEIVTKVGGYIILFSIFGAYINSLPIKNQIIKCIIAGMFEITTGINYIGKATFSMELKILLACVFNAFGGMSCIAQTYSIIHNSKLSIKKYIYHKLLITLLTAFMAYIMIYVL